MIPSNFCFYNKDKSIAGINPNFALDKYGIDLRLVINSLQKPLKRLVHRD